jgi:hypothetical protein
MRWFVVSALCVVILLAAAQPSYAWCIHHFHHHHSHPGSTGQLSQPMAPNPLAIGLPGGFSINIDGQQLLNNLQNRGSSNQPNNNQPNNNQPNNNPTITVAPEVTAALGRIETNLTGTKDQDGVDKLNALIAQVNKKLPAKTAAVKTVDALKKTTTSSPGTSSGPATPPGGNVSGPPGG